MAKKKKNEDWKAGLLLLAVVLLGVVGVFFSGMVWGRNYRSAAEAAFKKIGVLFVLIPCAVINLYTFGLFLPANEMETYSYGPVSIYRENDALKAAHEKRLAEWQEKKQLVEKQQAAWDLEDKQSKEAAEKAAQPLNRIVGAVFSLGKDEQEESAPLPPPRPVFDEKQPVYKPIGFEDISMPNSWLMMEITDNGKLLMMQEALLGLKATLVIFLLGAGVGFIQRGGRRQRYATEEANELFLQENHLKQTENGELVDIESGQVFRVESECEKMLTLFPVGTRGKRAYIYMDGSGRYTEFSGIVKAGVIKV
jgi:hypothetical protein